MIKSNSSSPDRVEELCPFCRSRDSEMRPLATETKEGWVVICVACSALGPTRQCRALAIAAWNSRAADSVTHENARDAIELIADGRFYEDHDESTAALGHLRALLSSRPESESVTVMREALEGMLGLVDLIASRSDLPPDLIPALFANHRLITAREALARSA